ncbi:calcineurin-like phosphoesterase [Thraustotheca clavata]|uniref:Serine/threonine-protein phosphatase n=1 Tax=Thraustotheca clavata TaxID=74557 RepID=A0A1W0A2M0_9STRA|nr:calcineurin-like phosphoesterase [Thraustotheca clavata]
MKLAAFLSSTPSRPVVFKKPEPPPSVLQKDWEHKSSLETIAIDEKAINYFKKLPIATCVTQGRMMKYDLDPMFVRNAFRHGNSLSVEVALELIAQGTQIMTNEPNILQLQAPMIVVGDLHGQFFDLLHLLFVHGDPSPTNQYLFLGDYVDRGPSSCEIILLLLAYKAKFPKYVHLLRGNHECRSVSTHYGFRDECVRKYGILVYNRVISCFESMPLAATIETAYGKHLALHGGLSPDIDTIEEINDLDRFVEPKPSGPLCDILWSDPTKDPEQHDDWAPNPIRGCSYMFSEHLVRSFLTRNKLLSIIRAHEMEETGFYEHYCKDISLEDFPPVVTVFSAPEYCNVYSNMGATLYLTYEWMGELEFFQHKRALTESNITHASEAEAVSEFLTETLPFLPISFLLLVSLCSRLGPGLHVVKQCNTTMTLPSSKKKKTHLFSGGFLTKLMTRRKSSRVDYNEPEKKPKSSLESQPKATTLSTITTSPTISTTTPLNKRTAKGFVPPSEMHPAAVISHQKIACIKVSSRIAELQNQIFQSSSRPGLPMCQPSKSVLQEEEDIEEEEEVVQPKRRSRSFHEVDRQDTRVAQIRRQWQIKANEVSEKRVSSVPSRVLLQRRPSVDKLTGQIDIMNVLQVWEQRKHNSMNTQTQSEPDSGPICKKQISADAFTDEEWRALKLYFSIVTRDDQGQLTKKKLGLLLGDQDKDAYATQDELSTILGAMDSDDDGVIGAADFLHFAYRAKQYGQDLRQPQLIRRFSG